MGAHTAIQLADIAVGETRTPAISFKDVLESGELLAGTPTIVEETTSDLTLANKRVNTAALTINGESVAIGQAVQFKINGQLTVNSPYTLKITVGTDASPAQTFVKKVRFRVSTS